MAQQLFVTARQKLLEAYKKAGQEFVATTLPYHSTASIKFEVINSANAAAGVGFAIARRGQVVPFFDYGVGESIDLGNVTRKATDADTNLAKGKSTNGAADFVIEGVGFSSRGGRIDYDDQNNETDKDVIAAHKGQLPIRDPAAIIAPPQVDSPFNLENALMQALIGYMSVEAEFDRENTKKLGAVDLLPQAGAQSYLRANGVPASGNRWMVPEGFLWRRDGEPDSELIMRVKLEEAIVVPLTLVTLPGDNAVTVPKAIYLDLVMRLFGLQVKLPSTN